jgi:hypothetical protein
VIGSRTHRKTTDVAEPTLAVELLDAALRAYAQLDGRDSKQLTEEDRALRNAFAQAFVAQLPAEVIERLVPPEWPTWETLVTVALQNIFSDHELQRITRSDRDAFQMLVHKVQREATRTHLDVLTVLKHATPLRVRLSAFFAKQPAVTIARHIPS